MEAVKTWDCFEVIHYSRRNIRSVTQRLVNRWQLAALGSGFNMP